MASLSERLKRERELRGISLKQISEETRIGVRFLEALEEGRLEIIPGEFYRRSYLRAYARYLGLDEERAVNAYDYSRKEKPAAKNAAQPAKPAGLNGAIAPTGEGGSEGESVPLPSWLKWAVAGAAVSIPALLLLRAMPASTTEPPSGALEGQGGGEPVISAPLPSVAEEPVELGEAVSLEPAPAPPPLRIASDAGPLRLVLTVEEDCWLEIEADGEVVATGLKDAGYRQRIVAQREVRMWLGNAGGVSLVLNDRTVKPLGRPGQVRKDLVITPDNAGDFLAPASGRS